MVYAKLLVVYSVQGGVGKTLTAVNLADTLARQGAKVLLIDWDERGQATQALGLPVRAGLSGWLLDSDPAAYRPHLLATGTKQLALLPGDPSLRAALQTISDDLAQRDRSPTHLQDHVQALVTTSVYDYVVCDTTPIHYDHLPEKILAAQPGTVVIPVAMDNLDLAAVEVAYATVQDWTSEAQVILLPTFFHPRWKITVANWQQLKAAYPGAVMEPIPYRPQLRVAQSYGLTIHEQDPKSDLLPLFAELVRWIQRSDGETLFGV